MNGLQRQIALAGLSVMVALGGCERSDQSLDKPTTTPSSQPAAVSCTGTSEDEPETELLAEARRWTRAEAAERLGARDRATVLSAAVQLARLAELDCLCLPEPLPVRVERRLRVEMLGEGLWGLGFASDADENVLRAPILLSAGGDAVRCATGTDEEAAYLQVSAYAALFPSIVVLPGRVCLAQLPLDDALRIKTGPGVRFSTGREGRYPHVGLVACVNDELVEVARYRWDPYEQRFHGPAVDKLPKPLGGKFELDIEGSPLLIPVGGEMPDPAPIIPPQRRGQPDERPIPV